MKFIRNLRPKEVEKRVEGFISLRKSRGLNTISTLDIAMGLKIPATQIEHVLEKFQKERNLKEIRA